MNGQTPRAGDAFVLLARSGRLTVQGRPMPERLRCDLGAALGKENATLMVVVREASCDIAGAPSPHVEQRVRVVIETWTQPLSA
jgi:hypothetical protein